MKLSLPQIAEGLNYKLLAPLSPEASLKMRFSRPVFHTGETTLRANTLYIAAAANLPGHLDLEPGCGLICLGAPDKTSSKQRLKDLLILSKYEDIHEVYNAINGVFERYESLEDDLYRIFTAPDFYQGLKTAAEIFSPFFSHKLLIDEAAGKIYLDAPNNDASRAEKSLINYLSSCVEKYKQTAAYSGSEKPDFKILLANAMKSGFVNPDVFKEPLEEMGWKSDDKYMLAMIASLTDLDASALENLIARFTGNFAYIPVFVYAGEIMALVNLNTAKFHNLPDESFIRQLDGFLKDTRLHSGVSNMFSDFYKLCEYRKQAKTALELGLKEKPDENIYLFSNFVPSYIRRKILEDFPASELFPSLYYKLKNYDEANNTDYLHTLEVYLEYDMNAVQAANALYIHRATIIYRIKKICEIGQTDLKNKEELLYMQLMLSIQPYEEASPDQAEEALAGDDEKLNSEE